MKITRTQSLSWGRKYFISKTNWKWHAAKMTVLIPLTLFIQGGIIPVILQSLRHMLHPNASHYSYPIFSYFCVSSTWQSSKGLKYHLWSCCLPPPPPTNPACSAVTQTLQAGVVKHCDIIRLSQFSSPFLYATDWHTHADHVLPVHIHCAPLSSIFTVRAGACGCHPVLLVIYFVPPVYTRAL